MTVVKSQSFCGGQNGLTILAKIIFKSLENIFDHLVRPFWPIFFWESFEFFMATMLSTVVCSINGRVTGFLGSLKISPCEERRLKDTQNLKCEDRRFQNYLALKTEDLATKPTKPEDRRFGFLTGKI